MNCVIDAVIAARIKERLKEIEAEHNVEILYAVESGSRAWGFASQDSDYDVRFIYRHPVDWYLSVLPYRDVVEYPIVDEYDYAGWDLRKTFYLMNKSNPVLLEWLCSPIIYAKNPPAYDSIKDTASRYFSPIASVYHYLHIARGNFRDYLKHEQVRTKKYFYVLRPLLACMWIEKYGEIPPIEFAALLNDMIDDGTLLHPINDLLNRKKSGGELGMAPRIPVLNDFIEERIAYFEKYAKEFDSAEKHSRSFLDENFIKVLRSDS